MRWVHSEIPLWPQLPEDARHALTRRYFEQELRVQAVLQALSAAGAAAESTPPLKQPPPPPKAELEDAEVVEPEPELEPTPEPASPEPASMPGPPETKAPAPSPPPTGMAAVLEVPRPVRRADRIVEEASTWARIWRPFLSESVGWFIGAFLIIAGTFWWVADAWGSMTSDSRALTVFGLAAGWTLAFVGWARFLSRRPATAPAGAVLRVIAATVAPLATVALGPLQQSLVFWPLVAGWSAVAGWLAFTATRAVDTVGARPGALLGAVTTFTLGAAPLLAMVGPAAVWLNAAPLVLAALSWRKGPRATREATRLAISAPMYGLALFAVRLHVALAHAHLAPSASSYAPLAALVISALLWLRPVRSAADAISVSAVAVQGALLVPAFVAPSPAFVVAALIATSTCVRLAMRRVSPASARWLYPAYALGYAAFQRIDQLVPQVVRDWYLHLKATLGYATAPLPPSYGSVYAALFVGVVGILAALRHRRAEAAAQGESHVLLRCTAIAGVVFGALSLLSLGDDPRPALIAAPVLMVLTAALGAWLDRRDLSWAGGALAIATAVAWVHAWHLASPLSALALVAALLAAYGRPSHRRVHLGVAGLLAVLGACVAFTPGGAEQVAALALSSAALWLVARTSDDEHLLQFALIMPFLTLVRGALLINAEAAPFVLAASCALASVAVRRGGKVGALWPATALAAIAAPLWHLATVGALSGPVFVASAVALLLGARRAGPRPALTVVVELVGNLFVLASLLPIQGDFAPWPWTSPLLSMVAALALAVGTSVSSVRSGRTWQAAVLSAGSVVVALAALVVGQGTPEFLMLAGVTALLATPSLLPSVTVPLAAVLFGAALIERPVGLLFEAAALSVFALLEEADVTWRWLLNRRAVSWAASLAALAVLSVAATLHLSPAVWLCAAVLPWAWVRATRSPVWVAVWVVALALLSLRLGGSWPLAVPPLVVLASRLLELGGAQRAFGLTRPTWTRAAVLTASLTAGLLTALDTLNTGHSPMATLAWAIALLLIVAEPLVLRIVAAAALTLVTPQLGPVAALVLLALAFALHHRPVLAGTLLGGSPRFSVAGASLSAVALALVDATAHGGPAWLLAATLLGAALLLGVPALLGIATLVLAVDVRALVDGPHLLLTPWAGVVAIVAAAGAAALQVQSVATRVSGAWARLGRLSAMDLGLPLWLGGAAIAGLALVDGGPVWLLVSGVLFITRGRAQAAVALGLLGAHVVVLLPTPMAAVVLAVGGLVLTWVGGWLERSVAVARVWHHAGWVLTVLSLGAAMEHHTSVAFAVCWLLAVGTAWGVVRRRPALAWLGWLGTALAAHALVGWLGVKLATGAPAALILPYFALVSAAVGALALRGGSQARWCGRVLGGWSLLELACVVPSLSGSHGREVVVALVAAVVTLVPSIWLALEEDDFAAAVMAQLSVAVGLVSARWLFAGTLSGLDAVMALMLGVGMSGLARFTAAEGRNEVAKAFRGGALLWPLVGLLVAPWSTPWLVSGLLLLHSLHFAVAGRLGLRRRGAVLSTLAFNAAVVCAWLASGLSGPEYLALPAGLSLLVLVRVFRRELAVDVAARLRAVAVTGIYLASAWRPLAFDVPWALWLCVVVCVAGVAAGIALRIRSYVFLGTGCLVTTVLASLVRYGVREPRLGALFLSALGLLVVGFMVLVTTRRTELLERFRGVQSVLARWEG